MSLAFGIEKSGLAILIPHNNNFWLKSLLVKTLACFSVGSFIFFGVNPDLLNLFQNVQEMAATAGVDDSVDIVDKIRSIARANQRFDECCERVARNALSVKDPSLTPAEQEVREIH